MPVGNHDQGRGSGGQSNKPRVDFSPSLDSIDSKYPQSPVGNHDGSTWDTETDHILSYFLGGDALVGGATTDEHGFASAPNSLSRGNSTSTIDNDNEQMHLPPTPAVQFYSHGYSHNSSSHDNLHQSHNRYIKQSSKSSFKESKSNISRKSNSSISPNPGKGISGMEHFSSTDDEHGNENSKLSTSSVSTMAASLVAGGFLVHQHHGQNFQHLLQQKHSSGLHDYLHNYGSENPSPISPAAMIGLSNENLLLPIPSPDQTPSSGKVGSRKKSSANSSSTGLNQQNVSHQSSTASNTMDGIFESNHAVDRMLPPERLLEVFQSQPAASTQNQGAVSAASATTQEQSTAAKNSGENIKDNSQQQISSTQSSSTHQNNTFEQHEIIFSHQAEFAAAILNRHHGLLSYNTTPQVETEEKRAKRLERNRESARKSRRKKKERLLTLGAQVNMLQNEIETERRKHINAIVGVMNKYRLEDIGLLLQQLAAGNVVHEHISDRTCVVIQQSGPNSRLMRSVLDFQYTTLKQLTLPSYQKLLLWFTLVDDCYFTAGKEEYAKRVSASSSVEVEKQGTKASPASSGPKNFSSKQIGDELFNGLNNGNTASGKKKRNKESDNGDRPIVTSNVYDGSRTWPLLSFELRLSVDQEERFLSTHKQVTNNTLMKYRLSDGKRIDSMENHRSQIAAAVNTAESLNRAVGSLSHVISRREDQTFARILSPQQLLAFQTWLGNPCNREKCRSKIASTYSKTFATQPADGRTLATTTTNIDMEIGSDNGSSVKESSLQDICRRLNQVLHISQR